MKNQITKSYSVGIKRKKLDTCFGAWEAKGSNASKVTIQGDIVVPV